MTVYPYSHRNVCTHGEQATLKCNAHNEIYLDNSFNVLYVNVSLLVFILSHAATMMHIIIVKVC